MAMEKSGYRDAQRGTTRVKVGINEDGNIAQASDVTTGSKTFTINKVNASNGLTDNQDVLNLFIGFLGGTTDQVTNTMTVKWSVN